MDLVNETLNLLNDVIWHPGAKEHFIYTLQHKKALLMVYTELFQVIPDVDSRLYYHDSDKLWMYTFLSEVKKASKLHRAYSIHHVENWRTDSIEDRLEAMLDYECARITKPDKPLNACRTVKELKPAAREDLEPILRTYGLWSEKNVDFSFELYNYYSDVIEKRILDNFIMVYEDLNVNYHTLLNLKGNSDIALNEVLVYFNTQVGKHIF